MMCQVNIILQGGKDFSAEYNYHLQDEAVGNKNLIYAKRSNYNNNSNKKEAIGDTWLPNNPFGICGRTETESAYCRSRKVSRSNHAY